MPYRLLRRNDPDGRPDPVWCSGDGDIDPFTHRNRSTAERSRVQMSRMFPRCDYVVVGSPNAYRWDELLRQHATGPTPSVVADDEDDDEDEDVIVCNHCGEEGHDEDDSAYHQMHYCERCDWTCDVPDCSDCVGYGPDGDWCEGCAQDYYDECGSEGTAGLTLTRCAACDSYDVHHDDLAEQFLCDCQARRRIDMRQPVTLAHPLPTLEVVA